MHNFHPTAKVNRGYAGERTVPVFSAVLDCLADGTFSSVSFRNGRKVRDLNEYDVIAALTVMVKMWTILFHYFSDYWRIFYIYTPYCPCFPLVLACSIMLFPDVLNERNVFKISRCSSLEWNSQYRSWYIGVYNIPPRMIFWTCYGIRSNEWMDECIIYCNGVYFPSILVP